MNVSRFFGATNREAMRQVRMALGPDALIVSNRRVNGGVEILATDQTSVSRATAAPAEAPARPSVQSQPPAAPKPPVGVSPADLMQALGTMKGMLESGFDELLWGAQLRKAPVAVTVFQKLLAMGFSTALLRAMLKKLPESSSLRSAMQWCRSELIAHLPVLEDEESLWAPGAAIALVGPTGVGKTTTVAKLAARCVRRFGPSSLVLITTDTYRIGAHEQLKIYGRMMGVPVHVAQDRNELGRLMAAVDPETRILVDNVGISQRDRHVGDQAAMLSGMPRTVERLLVLNAASQGDTLDEVARAYTTDGGRRPMGSIVTKLDESTRPGPALDIAIRYQLPVHYASTGQKVPEDLVHMDAEAWVDQALTPTQPASALFSPSAADLAALMEAPPVEPAAKRSAEKSAAGALPSGLLTLVGAGSMALDEGLLRAACLELDSSEVYSGAYGQWRRTVAGATDGAPWRPLAAARNELALLGQERMLALHDVVALPVDTARRKMHAVVLLAERGQALTTPWQQWPVGEGWQASNGMSGVRPMPATERLRRQIDFLNQSPGASSLVHVFEFPGQPLLRDLCERSVPWLAHCAGSTRIEVESCATTAAAHAKTLDYRCLDSALSRLDLATLQGVPVRDVALWAAESDVVLARRGADPLTVRQVSVRLIDRRGGMVMQTLHGLSSISADEDSVDALAVWLVLRAEARAMSRVWPGVWSLLEGTAERPAGERMASTIQIGLGAWHAVQQQQSVCAALAALAGRSGLRPAALPGVLSRLFAVKELLDNQAAH